MWLVIFYCVRRLKQWAAHPVRSITSSENIVTMHSSYWEGITRAHMMLTWAPSHGRSANLILNLFSLMLDSNVPDIALEPDKTIQKVRDRFCLNLTEEQAVQNLQQLMDDSISALFPQMVEQIHRWAQVRYPRRGWCLGTPRAIVYYYRTWEIFGEPYR